MTKHYKILRQYPLSRLSKYKKHKRLRVFHHKGVQCVSCQRVGTKILVTQHKGGDVHLDVFTHDDVLMTIDHIHPKSKGGTNHLSNLQPMCSPCNSKKGDSIPHLNSQNNVPNEPTANCIISAENTGCDSGKNREPSAEIHQ